jgi:transposase
VDEQEPRRLRPQQVAISERSDRRRMGTGRTADPAGYDAGKKIKGKKRHILVDTLGLLLHAIVHPADIQDRNGGVLVMATLFGMFPFLKTLFADSGYQGDRNLRALAKVLPHLDIEIVKRSDQVSGFVVLPKRVAQSLPKARQGLGESQPKGARVLTPRLNPPHAQKTMQSSPEVSGRTLRKSPMAVPPQSTSIYSNTGQCLFRRKIEIAENTSRRTTDDRRLQAVLSNAT